MAEWMGEGKVWLELNIWEWKLEFYRRRLWSVTKLLMHSGGCIITFLWGF